MSRPFDPIPYCTGGLTSGEVLDLKETFDLFEDGSGTVSMQDLAEVLRSLAFDSNTAKLAQDPSLHQLLADVRLYGEKRVTFDVFLRMVLNRTKAPNNREHNEDKIERMFQLFDRRSVGAIALTDLKEVFGEVQINIPENKMKEMIQKADSNQDGEVSRQDFRRIMTRKI